MAKLLDCIICGSCVVDVLCRPVRLDRAIGVGLLHESEPAVLTGGGITINSGATMSRLGAKVSVLSLVGPDAWAPVVRNMLRAEGIDDQLLTEHVTEGTSTTVVMIDPLGERSFFHCVGAPRMLTAGTMLDQIDAFGRAKICLFGYYSLMPNLEPDLPEVFRQIRRKGCQTAMDAAGAGGQLEPLDRILPELDIYVPSYNEARNQTGHDDPRKIIKTYRACGASGLLGVKLGKDGVLLSPTTDQWIDIPVLDAPGKLIDTTGAGDSFYGGLLVGLMRGLSVEQAGRLGAAAAACCVTVVGGSTGGRDYAFTSKLAGLT